MINFKNTIKKDLTCYDAMLSTIADYYNVFFEPRFLNYFGFEFDIYHDNTGQVIVLNHCSQLKGEDLYTKSCGIEIIPIDLKDKHISAETLQNLLKSNSIIGIHTDSFFLPWNSSYRKAHQGHYILIVNIINDEAVCVDSYLLDKPTNIKLKSIINKIDSIILFNYNQELIEYNSFFDVKIKLKMLFSKDKKHINDLYKFAHSIDKIDFDKHRYDDWDKLAFSKLIKCVTHIMWSRKNFKECLVYYKNKWKSNEFNEIILELEKLYDKWSQIQGLFIKVLISDSTDCYIDRIHKILYLICESEVEVFKHIENLELG